MTAMPSIKSHLIQDDEQVPTFSLSQNYQQAAEFNPDVVVILLGTEDSKQNYWKTPEKFQADYVDLIQKIKSDFEKKP